MKRIGLAMCLALGIACGVAGCEKTAGTPTFPDGARYDNGGSLGGGGRSGGIAPGSDSAAATPINGGSLGGGGR
ncbi:hypothetical protein [Longimicrobium sp.]|uniref:hypothetical protein n=1 Tax=Longimicrobium sp. TaxID=2029185 RepID=UPI002BEADE32|nr:hypothetical protein [Longimicrobium sp.]HSU17569.1 hypothetical protein [Longimicrobium sp.]